MRGIVKFRYLCLFRTHSHTYWTSDSPDYILTFTTCRRVHGSLTPAPLPSYSFVLRKIHTSVWVVRYDVYPYVFLLVRTVTGPSLSSLNSGRGRPLLLCPLSVPEGSDLDWIVNPPSSLGSPSRVLYLPGVSVTGVTSTVLDRFTGQSGPDVPSPRGSWSWYWEILPLSWTRSRQERDQPSFLFSLWSKASGSGKILDRVDGKSATLQPIPPTIRESVITSFCNKKRFIRTLVMFHLLRTFIVILLCLGRLVSEEWLRVVGYH